MAGDTLMAGNRADDRERQDDLKRAPEAPPRSLIDDDARREPEAPRLSDLQRGRASGRRKRREPDDMPDPMERQVPVDRVEEASMESFPCSDPPSFVASHA